MRSVFGDHEPVSLEVGISKMAEWAKAKGPRRTPEFEGVELWKNFPAGWESAVKRGDDDPRG